MAGFLPDEGETFIAEYVLKKTATDRGTGLELGLFTNSTVNETTKESDLTEPTGTGYARKTLTDGSWTVSGDTGSYAQQTFTAGGDWTGDVRGYFIATTGTTPRILAIEVDPNGPYTIKDADTYKVTPSITVA
jgi:hypothetical protein